MKGQVTSTAAHEYSLVDAGAAHLGQKIYYRLKQVDMDGTTVYLPMRAIAFAAAQVNIILYPNPATTEVHLDLRRLAVGTYTVSLVDLSGRLLSTQHLDGGQVHTLDLQHLPNGAYVILINGQDTHLTRSLVKQDQPTRETSFLKKPCHSTVFLF